MPQLQTVPRQSANVYRLLNESGELTAKQVAKKLGIMPNAVYRAIKPLTELGMAVQTSAYPVRYKASPTPDAMNWYLRAAEQSFRRDFGSPKPRVVDTSLPSITFIKDRKGLLKISEQEILNSNKTINYIVSGHTIPDSSVLAFRKASTIGVKVRAIIQNTPESTKNPIENYSDLGVEVRYLPNIGIRLFVFDGKSAIMTSYDIAQSSRAFGIKFNYLAVAKQLDELFEQRWLQAQPLS
jgi:sugar-specific transcriptional regulator TrmB